MRPSQPPSVRRLQYAPPPPPADEPGKTPCARSAEEERKGRVQADNLRKKRENPRTPRRSVVSESLNSG